MKIGKFFENCNFLPSGVEVPLDVPGAFRSMNFQFYLIKRSAKAIWNNKYQGFAWNWLFLGQIFEKRPQSTYQRQTANFTRRALWVKGWRRVLRTIIKIYLKINSFFLFLLYFECIFQRRNEIHTFFKNAIFLPYGVQKPLAVVQAFRWTNIHFYLIKKLAEAILNN